MNRFQTVLAGSALFISALTGANWHSPFLDGVTLAQAAEVAQPGAQISPGLALPALHPDEGKKLFASKGCVVCHAINGVGGTDAPALDASTMAPVMSPFDFFAKMWNHSQGMIAMQQNELGGQITFTGQEIADIIAFVHDADLQKSFSEDDIPAEIKEHMEEGGMEHMGTMMDGKGEGSSGN
jgi:mono/diheme cytochrome c family protein